MKNKVLLVFLAMVLVVSLAAFGACKAEEEEPTPPPPPLVEPKPEPEPEPEPAWEWPETIKLIATSPTATTYAQMLAWSTLLAEDTGMKIRMATEEGRIMLRWVQAGRFFSCVSSGLGDVYEATEDYATRDGGPWQARYWYVASISNMGFAVRKDSPIKTPYDIEPGTKVIELSGYGAALARRLNSALLAWGNVSPDDVEFVPAGSFDAQIRFLAAGKGDIAFMAPAAPYSFEVEASPSGLAWIEMNAKEDPEGAKRFMDLWPHFSFSQLEYGVPSAIGVHMMTTVHGYIARAEADTELVYRMTKWLAENYDRYKGGHPTLLTSTLDNLMLLAEHDYTPLHDGTVRYLEEKGLWTQAHEARRQANIALLDRYVQAYQEAIDMADDKGISVSPSNEEWLDLWENYKKDLDLPKFKLFPGLD